MAKVKVEVFKGDKYHRLTVLEPRVKQEHNTWYHKVSCSCGNEKLVAHSNLVLGKSKSCGCLAREATSKSRRTHGMSNSPEYQTWNRMWNRCTNPIVDRYPNYGGRGISVCSQWRNFVDFYADMGPKPSPSHSIGRIDNDGDYCKSNCRWETKEQQSSNTSTNVFIEHNGLRLTISQWARKIGQAVETINQRYHAGMSPDRILEPAHLSKRSITVDGITRLTTEWMKTAGIPISSFYHHQRKGMCKEDIVRLYLKKNES